MASNKSQNASLFLLFHYDKVKYKYDQLLVVHNDCHISSSYIPHIFFRMPEQMHILTIYGIWCLFPVDKHYKYCLGVPPFSLEWGLLQYSTTNLRLKAFQLNFLNMRNFNEHFNPLNFCSLQRWLNSSSKDTTLKT